MLKCLALNSEVEKRLQQNKKLENLKKYFLEVKNYTKLIEVVVEKKDSTRKKQ